MSEVKLVKVDNWGVYFLQRLKHFFNRTDYCDLTLQFLDNAQLKVHRLVLSACTEYFELLERTCEMYEDCLVMPDDLQADVVVPIVNFMYTGQLEFTTELLDRLYQTSQIMAMPVLTKLLENHRLQTTTNNSCINHTLVETNESQPSMASPQISIKPTMDSFISTPSTSKRSYSKAFDRPGQRDKKINVSKSSTNKNIIYCSQSHVRNEIKLPPKKVVLGEPRPTRYELPEEFDMDNVFNDSFTSISYASKPLTIHPEAVKRYPAKHSGIFSEASSSKIFSAGTSTMDIVECKKLTNTDNIFEDSAIEHTSLEECDMFQTSDVSIRDQSSKDSNQLFDQIIGRSEGPKVTVDTKSNKLAANLDHAKIISEVLKKYPHLVKSNKNIKLKILNTSTKTKRSNIAPAIEHSPGNVNTADEPDFTYETDVIDSKQAARLIALGAENVKGPWICLICGTPGRALHFTSYHKFRRHLVDVHKEKPVSNICEYCGLKSFKRNYLLHHIYTKHGIPPPPQYNFPKCNVCNYIALTEGFLIKHKLTHGDRGFRCNVCSNVFPTSNQLLQHIQKTGHKYSSEKKNLQCVYCLKGFMRETNLFAHIKTHHKKEAKSDGIIEDSDEDKSLDVKPKIINDSIQVKYEPANNIEFEDMDVQYQMQPDGNIHVVSKKKKSLVLHQQQPAKQTILNSGFTLTKTTEKKMDQNMRNEFLQNMSCVPNNSLPTKTEMGYENEGVVVIDNKEYILRDNQLIPKTTKSSNAEYILSDLITTDNVQSMQDETPTTSMEFTTVHNTGLVESDQQPTILTNKDTNIGQPIQFVVSNEEEYKALMAANHPIIFDDGNANKTLTVLTAPHNTAIDTATIDLNNAQSNDMMIIQENYPLNVSETGAADNSNIVVVYSHPVGDSNKQFQLITTQGIGAQFVQSSAIITQNFETVTTSAPIMNAHVINPQEVWQNEMQTTENHEVHLAPTTDPQTIDQTTQADIVSEENDNDLNDLPDVNLMPQEPQETPTTSSEIVQSLDKPDLTSVIEDTKASPVEENITYTENIESTAMYVDKEPETILNDNSNNVEISPDIQDGDINTKDVAIDATPVTENETEVALTESSAMESQEDTAVQNDANGRVESPTFTQNMEPIIEESIDSCEQSNVSETIADNAEPELTVVGNKKIHNLTSEWTEDEYDDSTDGVEKTQNRKHEIESLVTDATPEVEESIENIQQEVDKQMSIVSGLEPETEDSLSQDDDAPEIAKPEESPKNIATTVVVDSSEKISSLLNDWEDSQEEALCDENIGKVQPVDEQSEIVTNDPVLTSDENSDKQAPKTDDNIKSLVEDWDDDEESKD